MATENMAAYHGLIMENRKKLNLTGVKEIVSFNDEEVHLITALGRLNIKGNNIKIGAFQTDCGALEITGDFYAFVYSGDNSTRESFFKKLFR